MGTRGEPEKNLAAAIGDRHRGQWIDPRDGRITCDTYSILHWAQHSVLERRFEHALWRSLPDLLGRAPERTLPRILGCPLSDACGGAHERIFGRAADALVLELRARVGT